MIIYRISLFLLAVFSLSLFSFGQTTTPTPNQDIIEQQRARAALQRQKDEYENKTMGELAQTHGRSNGSFTPRISGRKNKNYPSDKELNVIAPDATYFQQYKDFLKQKDTGLVRLVSDVGCGTDSRIVKVKNDCIKYEKIPGYGSTYSFRTDQYVLGRYADVVYKNGVIYSFGNLTTGFLTGLNDVSIADITGETAGVSYMYSFVPKKNLNEIKKQNENLVEGVIADGFGYRKSIKLSAGKTFILRSVAYKAKIKNMRNGRTIKYNNTDFDNRKDVIVAFRVLGIDEDGSATLLWKVLEKKNAPKIVFPK